VEVVDLRVLERKKERRGEAGAHESI